MVIIKNLVEWYKKFLKISTSVTNFILTFLIYFLGVSISHILWRLTFRKKQFPMNSYWQFSNSLPKKLKEYFDQY